MVASQALAETLSELVACPTHALIVNTGADGVAVTHDIEKLRSQAPGMPVIACSVPNPMTRVPAAGADGHLIKPVSRESLIGAILQLPKGADSVLVVDDDPESSHLIDAFYDRSILVLRSEQQPAVKPPSLKGGARCRT